MNSGTGAAAFGGLLLMLVIAAVYFLPTILSALRGKRNTAAIFALNLLLGWTAIGWIVALVWSLTADPLPATQQVVVHTVTRQSTSHPPADHANDDEDRPGWLKRNDAP